MSTADRIARALESGPLYEGALHLIVGAPSTDFYRNLRNLEQAGKVARCADPLTWKLAS